MRDNQSGDLERSRGYLSLGLCSSKWPTRSYTEAFNSGGISDHEGPQGTVTLSCDSEFIENTEMGIRTDLMCGRFHFGVVDRSREGGVTTRRFFAWS